MAKKVTLEHVDQKFDSLSGRFDEFMEFMKENVAMKSEVQESRTELKSEIHDLRSEMKSEMQDLRSEVFTVADQITKLQQTVEIELIAPTHRMDRLERRVTVVEHKLGLAT